MNLIPLLQRVMKRGIRPSLGLAFQGCSYFARNHYIYTSERVCPGFPNYIFENHLKVYKFLQQFVHNKIVLDLGCGTGYGSLILSESANRVEAVDYSPQAIRFASRCYSAQIFHSKLWTPTD